jgi:Mlc titration factor MtfA (ptsG expression regulator)
VQRWRQERTIKKHAIPDALWDTTLSRFPFLTVLDDSERGRLRDLSSLFLADKQFSGAQGLDVTDEMALAVAAQACLPILNLGLGWYDGFIGIVMHAGEMLARREATDEDGIVHRYDEALTGEAVERGPITLSWQDVASAGDGAASGYNVVIHELAHVLDMRNGEADGMPPLVDRELRHLWRRTFSKNYESFCQRVDTGEDTWLDPYGSEAPSEFFAVACEAFFVAPHAFQAEHAELYGLLSRFFQQDPATRSPAPR